MIDLNMVLYQYAFDTENPETNWALASEYDKLGQTASAISFYLRAAERTTDRLLQYECLLKIAKCFIQQGNRTNTVRGLYKHAMCLLPERPEAYYLSSKLNEQSHWYIESYMNAETGLNFSKEGLPPLRTHVGYPGRYGLLFQKAVASWWWGKHKECEELFLELKYKHPLDQIHLAAVNNNIKNLKFNESPYLTFKYKAIDDNKIDLVIQGKYSEQTDKILETYSKLDFVGNIIVSSWNDNPPVKPISNIIRSVKNSYPTTPGTDNRNLQIISSREGLAKVRSEISVKMRSDQYYTADSMNRMYDFYMRHPRRDDLIFVAGMFPNLIFHPRDHLFWGKTEKLKMLFDIPLEYNGVIDKINVTKNNLAKYYAHFIRTETYIGAHYAARFDDEVNLYLLEPNKYLYDNAACWQTAYSKSLAMMPKLFKSFPCTNIEMYWMSKNMPYPYEGQRDYYNERWDEDGY